MATIDLWIDETSPLQVDLTRVLPARYNPGGTWALRIEVGRDTVVFHSALLDQLRPLFAPPATREIPGFEPMVYAREILARETAQRLTGASQKPHTAPQPTGEV